MRHLRHLIAVAALAVLVLAACGDDAGVEPTGQDAAEGEEPSPEDPVAPEDDEDPLVNEEDNGTDNGANADDTGANADDNGANGPAVTGTFQDPDGEVIGTVELADEEGATAVSVEAAGLEPGFRGLHVHEIGLCEPDSEDPEDPGETGDFLSAGAHLNPDDTDHPEHAGDLSPLLVTEDGEATLTVHTDRFTVDELQDEDGTAFMIHSDRDNFAHIPEDRYGEPDQDTLDTGDAGDRVGCAVIE